MFFMYANEERINFKSEDNISNKVLEKIIFLKNEIKNLFKSKNTSESALNEYLNNIGNLLFSYEEFSMEFTAFANLMVMLDYLMENHIMEENKVFVEKNIYLFFDLVESKILLIKNNNNLISQENYKKQVELYDNRFFEYNSYFYNKIYEKKSEDNRDAIELGKILLGF